MRNNILKYQQLVLLLLCGLYIGLVRAEPDLGLKLEGLDGRQHSLSEYVGQIGRAHV